MAEISRQAYADMFGPTTGDKVRLADSELWIEVEDDLTVYGEEVKFGGGKVIRDGMGQGQMTADGCVDLYSGEDALITPILSLGGKGVISVLAIVAPAQTHNICKLYFEGKTEEAVKEQLRAVPLINALFSEVNPIPVKKAMNLMGKGVGPLRRPLTEMEDAHAEALKQAMKDYGIL